MAKICKKKKKYLPKLLEMFNYILTKVVSVCNKTFVTSGEENKLVGSTIFYLRLAANELDEHLQDRKMAGDFLIMIY